MWAEEGSVLWRPEAGPELAPVLDITVVEEQMVDRLAQRAFGALAETVHEKCEIVG